MSPVKTAEPIELPFGLRTQVVPGNHVLDGGPDTPSEGANWGKEVPIVSIGTFCRELLLTVQDAVCDAESGGCRALRIDGCTNVRTGGGTFGVSV